MWLERGRLRHRTVALAVTVVIVAGIVASLPGRWSAHDAGDTKRYGGLSSVLEGSLDPRSPALRTRLGLWRRTFAMVRDHAWLGVGPGNWPVVFPEYAEPNAARDGVLTPTLAPRQAHDDLLERAAETGVPGGLALLVLAAGTVLAVRRRLETNDPRRRNVVAAAAGSLAALVAISVVSFPLEMPGTIVLTGLSLGLIVTGGRRRSVPARRAVGITTVAIALLLVAWTAARAQRSVQSSLFFGLAERALHRDHGATGAAEASVALERSLALHPAFGPELREAQTSLRDSHPGESILASERALAIEPYSPNAWATLAAAQLAAGDVAAARASASRALELVHDYPFALDLRAKAATILHDVTAAQRDHDELMSLAAGAEDEDTRAAAQALLKAP